MNTPDTQPFAVAFSLFIIALLIGVAVYGSIKGKRQKFTQEELDKDRKALEDLRDYYLKSDPLPERHIYKTFSAENNLFMQKQYDLLYHSIKVSRIKRYDLPK